MKGATCKECLHPILTEVQDVTVTTDRSRLRAAFLQKENEFSKCDLKNLEKTLKINKQLISTLIKENGKLADTSKETLSKLNEENAFLQNQIKTLKKQRDDYHGKYLIAQQIIEELKAKNKEELADHKAKVAELLEEMNKKEYVTQHIQHKYHKMLVTLKSFATKEPEIAELLWELNTDTTLGNKKISNVIEENKMLLKEIARVHERIHDLEVKLKDGRAGEASPTKLTVPNDYSSSMNAKKGSHTSDHTRHNSIQTDELLSANDHLNVKIKELEDKNSKLARINACLHSTLHSLNGNKTPSDVQEQVKDVSACLEVPVQEETDKAEAAAEFGDLSSILNKIDEA